MNSDAAPALSEVNDIGCQYSGPIIEARHRGNREEGKELRGSTRISLDVENDKAGAGPDDPTVAGDKTLRREWGQITTKTIQLTMSRIDNHARD